MNHVKWYLVQRNAMFLNPRRHDKIIPRTLANDWVLVGFGAYFLIMDSYSLNYYNDIAFVLHAKKSWQKGIEALEL